VSRDKQPWLGQYDAGQPPVIEPKFDNMVDVFRATVAREPYTPLIEYSGSSITASELDDQSSAFAAALAHANVAPGDRIALYMQNIPQYVVALLGIWKAAAIAVNINPMNKERELRDILQDSGAKAIVCQPSLVAMVSAVRPETALEQVIIAEPFGEPQGTAFPVPGLDAAVDTQAVIARFRQVPPPGRVVCGDDTAVLTYTSGTTGPPKGAMITHKNIAYNVEALRSWIGIGRGDVILGVSPLFHVTGLVGQIGLCLLTGATLILMERFEPEKAVALTASQKATFAVGSITIFVAMMSASNASREAMHSLTKIYSGGAAIPPAFVDRFESRLGHYIHNIYGLTETTSPTHCVPLNGRAPVDAETGALSVGLPIYGTHARILEDDGRELPPGRVGELVVRGPQVVPGYWNQPEQTASAIVDGELRTGDIAYMDGDGWFYIVDRKKDQINAGGFKIWPREVVVVIYEHPAVREVAVVGVPDDYRGETVKAFVSLNPATTVSPEELIDFTRQRLAAYKYPRQVEIVPELAKTASGKILRRHLRSEAAAKTPKESR
jgi:long-chain acyl-CoA synthetase